VVVIQIGSAGLGAFNASEHISDEHPLIQALLVFAILGLSGRPLYEAWRGPAPAVPA
jgi:hypothetical protein